MQRHIVMMITSVISVVGTPMQSTTCRLLAGNTHSATRRGFSWSRVMRVSTFP
jgi:hypothetical protein